MLEKKKWFANKKVMLGTTKNGAVREHENGMPLASAILLSLFVGRYFLLYLRDRLTAETM